MASLSMAMPRAAARCNCKRQQPLASVVKIVPVKASKQVQVEKLRIEAYFPVAGITTVALVAPEVAQAAEGVTPSLKNFLLSIGAGGIVLLVIIGAIIAVSNFDPVKRR